jgi:hypothetical protein
MTFEVFTNYSNNDEALADGVCTKLGAITEGS